MTNYFVRYPQLIATLFFVGFSLYILMPIYWLIVNSTKSTSDLFSTFGFWFSSSPDLWGNIVAVFTQEDGVFSRWMLNTILYSTSAALGATFLGFLAGYAFAKWQFVGREKLFWLVLFAIMIPGAALAVPTFQLVRIMGIGNTPWAVILPLMVSPFAMYLLTVYINASVPNELIDAARMDGANEPRILGSVVLPISGPALVTVFLITFVGAWNNYLLPLLVLQSPDLMPVTVGLNVWNTQSLRPTTGSEILYSSVVAGSLLSITPLVLVFVFLQRYLRSGLTLGAVK